MWIQWLPANPSCPCCTCQPDAKKERHRLKASRAWLCVPVCQRPSCCNSTFPLPSLRRALQRCLVICTRRAFAYVVLGGLAHPLTAGCACGGPLCPSCVTPALCSVPVCSPCHYLRCSCVSAKGVVRAFRTRHEPVGLALLQASRRPAQNAWLAGRLVSMLSSRRRLCPCTFLRQSTHRFGLAFAAACQCSTTKHCRLPWGCHLRPVQFYGARLRCCRLVPKGCTPSGGSGCVCGCVSALWVV